jgi:hypothetical protein
MRNEKKRSKVRDEEIRRSGNQDIRRAKNQWGDGEIGRKTDEEIGVNWAWVLGKANSISYYQPQYRLLLPENFS